MRRLLAALCLALAGASAHSQTVYRCGAVYSQTPCEQGLGRKVDVSDERSAEQRAYAEARMRDDQALGDALQRERLDRAMGTPAMAAHINARPVPTEPAPGSKTSTKKKKKGSSAQSQDFKAIAPPAKAKRASV